MLRLYLNQSWGSVRTESRSFAAADGDVVAGTDEKAKFPLFGFQLPAESYRLATWSGASVRLFPPPAARLERSQKGGAFHAVGWDQLERDGEDRFLTLTPGTSVRLVERDQVLTVTLDEQKERAGWDRQKAAFWLVFLIVATIGGPIMFLMAGPDPTLVTRALAQARVKQGLPEKPEPIDLGSVDPSASDASQPDAKPGEKPRTKVVLPASVR